MPSGVANGHSRKTFVKTKFQPAVNAAQMGLPMTAPVPPSGVNRCLVQEFGKGNGAGSESRNSSGDCTVRPAPTSA